MEQQLSHRVIERTDHRLSGLLEWLRCHPEGLSLIIVGAIVAFLSLTNLAGYPTISGWDEGIFLQFSRNLAYYGEFATRNGNTFERLMPLASVGPTLIAPAALALWLGGGSLVAARLVVVLYLWAGLAGVYLLVRQIGGWQAALGSVLLFLVAGTANYDTLWMGRQLLGEVPALALMIVGLWFWLKSWPGGLRWLIISTILLGLAIVTKSQLILILGPSFVLFGLIDRIYYRQLRLIHTIVPVIGVVLGYVLWWSVLALWVVGPEGRAGYLEAQAFATKLGILHVTPQRWLENLKFFYTSNQWLITFVTLAYGFYRSWPRNLAGMKHFVLPLFISVALLGYVGVGFPWPRYLYPILALVALSVPVLVSDLAGWVGRRWQFRWLPVMAWLLAMAVLAGPGLVQNVQRITTTNDLSASRFAQLLDQQIPADANVLNWEWEIEFYSRQKFIHPPNTLFIAMVDEVYNHHHASVLDEPRLPSEADYLIVGPFAKYVQAFNAALAQRPHRLVVTEGPYQLYQLD
jgi:4-amino-4-deoxy-L-arabinose transferase-like glycosyltransferase